MPKQVYRRAVISGGSSGIGFAIASFLAAEASEVILIARNPDRLAQAEKSLKESYPKGSISSYPLDIADREAVKKVTQNIIKGKGIPDLLVNCAGMAYPDYFEKLDSTIFDRTVETNLTGTWNMLKALVPHMKRGSRVVNVSSVAGLVGTFGYTAYAATKFGIIGMSEALRNELSLKGIKLSVLCPPDTNTPQLKQENLTKPAETKAISGNAGIMQPEAVAKALFKGLKHNRFIIIPGFEGKMIYLLKRILPKLVFIVIDSTAKAAAKKQDEL